jgi:hypothetical protein
MRSLFKRKGSKKQAASGKALATEVPDDYESSTAESDERDDDALPIYQGSGQYKESKNTKGFKHGKESNIRSRDGVPIITSEGADHFSPSAVSGKNNYAVSGFFTKQKDHTGSNRPRVRPAAKAAAFGGAPRYDWMDIVSFFLRGRKMRTHMMCVLFEMSLLLSLTNISLIIAHTGNYRCHQSPSGMASCPNSNPSRQSRHLHPRYAQSSPEAQRSIQSSQYEDTC